MAKLMLHACCGPCSLEPVRLLRQEGFEPYICWANDNIQPASEYMLRLSTLKTWAEEEHIEVIETAYEPEAWEKVCSGWGFDKDRRCVACYVQRLDKACAQAAKLGFTYISTTLAVSPYQRFDVYTKALERLAKKYGLIPIIRDYRPYYPNATTRSRELGMYRQNYCGCRFSAAEACIERHQARDQRKAQKARQKNSRA